MILTSLPCDFRFWSTARDVVEISSEAEDTSEVYFWSLLFKKSSSWSHKKIVSYLPSCNFVQHENTRFLMKNKNKHESAQLARAKIRKHMNTNLNTKMSNNFQETAEKSQFTFYSVSLRSKLDFFPYGDSVIKMS